MIRHTIAFVFLFVLTAPAFSFGSSIKTSSVIEQPDVEVLGEYKGFWYAIGFDKPGNLHKPPAYKLMKYSAGFPTSKLSSLYPSFGEKTLYLRSAIINNKISVFYGRCEKRDEVASLIDEREGRRQIANILRQDYDPTTLEPLGEPVMVFDEADDYFACSGIEIAHSEDGSKTAVLVKCYYSHQFYKVYVTDNRTGEEWNRKLAFKDLKEYLSFNQVRVGNDGRVVVAAKVRYDVISIHTSSKDKHPDKYYFFSVEKGSKEPAQLVLESPVGGKYMDMPQVAMLNNGQTAVAYCYYGSDKSKVVKGISVARYDAGFGGGAHDIEPDPEFITQAADYNSKKEKGLPFLELRQLLPLEGGGFMVIAEHNRELTKPGDSLLQVERHYLVTYRFDDNMALKESRFLPKKQSSERVGYALSAQAYRKGNDVYLFHNDNWESDDDHDTNLMCTRLPANGAAPETTKIVHTSDDYLTSMQQLYTSADGKVLLTEIKLVEFEDVSKLVKLLEVTLK